MEGANNRGEERWRVDLRSVVYSIFFKLLQVNPPERSVVVCESLLAPQPFRSALADLLLGFLQVSSVLFVPGKGAALIPLQMETALVVDTGYHETRILPVYLGAHIINGLRTTVLAGKAFNDQLKSMLHERAVIVNAFTNTSRSCDQLEELVVEDIKVRLCSIQPQPPEQAGMTSELLAQTMRYNVNAEEYIDIDVYTCVHAGEFFFGTDGDEGEAPIAAAVLDSLLEAPIDARCLLSQNILVIGGTARIPGFRRRLHNEIKRLVDTNPAYASLKALTDQFCVTNPAFPPHYLSWLGGSFLGYIEHDLAITQAQYQEKKYKFPDWLRVVDVKRMEKGRRHPHILTPLTPSSAPSSTTRRRLLSLALSSGSIRTRLSSSLSLSLLSPYAPPSPASPASSPYRTPLRRATSLALTPSSKRNK